MERIRFGVDGRHVRRDLLQQELADAEAPIVYGLNEEQATAGDYEAGTPDPEMEGDEHE